MANAQRAAATLQLPGWNGQEMLVLSFPGRSEGRMGWGYAELSIGVGYSQCFRLEELKGELLGKQDVPQRQSAFGANAKPADASPHAVELFDV
jgi:hypothetical protein